MNMDSSFGLSEEVRQLQSEKRTSTFEIIFIYFMGGILIPFPAPADWVRGLNIRAREVG